MAATSAGSAGAPAAAGAPARTLEIPGVPCRAEQRALRRRSIAELRRRRRSDQDRACRAQPRDHAGVDAEPLSFERARSSVGWSIGDRGEVLRREWDPFERPRVTAYEAFLRRARVLERRIVSQPGERVDRRIQFVHARERCIDELDGGDVT